MLGIAGLSCIAGRWRIGRGVGRCQQGGRRCGGGLRMALLDLDLELGFEISGMEDWGFGPGFDAG